MIQHLRGRASFTRLRAEGTRVRSGPVWCVMLLDPSLNSPFVAYAIGRAAGSAVDRNRARRRLREILASVELSPGLYLFGLNGSAATTSFSALRSSVLALLSRQAGSRPAGG